MYNLHLVIGPVQVGLETDEKLSFDGIETLLNRGMMTALTLFNGHMGAMVKYENYDNDHECEECESLQEISNKDEEI
jgi:hypothetical protein